MTPIERLQTALAPDVVSAIAELVEERVRAELDALGASSVPEWVTPEQAALDLGCTPDAVRRRAKRGRLESRYQGRSIYISRASIDTLGPGGVG